MKNAIREYIEYSEEEKKELWDTATFVFDTNVFLNLYRYSNNTRKQLLDAIEKLKPRIWMPYQVAYEFCKDRYSVIEESNKRFDDIGKDADRLIKDWKQTLRLDDNNEDIATLRNYLLKWIKDNKKKNFLVFDISNDKIFTKLLELFDGKTGEEISSEDKKKIEKEGEERFERKTPPGYKDNAKTDNKYGDLFVWKEIIQYSKSHSVDVVFITHDRKEDWWNTCAGKTIGPRVELRKEFYQETQRRFHMYTMTSFLSLINDIKKDSIDKKTIQEVETITNNNQSNILYKDKKADIVASSGIIRINDNGTISLESDNQDSFIGSFKFDKGKYAFIPEKKITTKGITFDGSLSPIYVTRPEVLATVIPDQSITSEIIKTNDYVSPIYVTNAELPNTVVKPQIVAELKNKKSKNDK